MLDELVAGLTLWDRFKNWRDRKQDHSHEPISARFVRLFESHGVHRNQIPRFFGHGLTLKDVQDDASLIVKLDELILRAAAEKFAVRIEWLDGAQDQPHPCHDFYKHPEDFVTFIEKLLADNPNGDTFGTLLAPTQTKRNSEALLILQETIGAIGEQPIYRYHICNNWDFSYWKSRAYLTACIAIAWKHQVSVRGVYVPNVELTKIHDGNTLLGWQGEGIWAIGHGKWYAEDLALVPETFLKGIDPERNNFGIKSALQLWLELDQQGFMKTGVGGEVRPLFEKELSKFL